MQEIKIPEGHKATILGGVIRFEPIEPKFKRGDIVKWNGHKTFIGIVLRENRHDGRENYVIANPMEPDRKLADSCYVQYVTLATSSEQQILFDALAKKSKYWDAEALEVKDFIKVPESIGIYRSTPEFEEQGDNLYIGFNNEKQVLGYDNGVYTVSPIDDTLEKVQCYLQPCKREDLKAGDTCFATDELSSFDSVDLYNKVLKSDEYAYTSGNIGVGVIDDLDYKYFYKLIPINDNH